MVRTAINGRRSRRGLGREARDKNVKGLEKSRMAVQRLVALLPIEEQWQGGLAQESHPLPAEPRQDLSLHTSYTAPLCQPPNV